MDSGTQSSMETSRVRIRVQPVVPEAEKPKTSAKVGFLYPFQEVCDK